MRYRSLGRSGLKVSELCLGTMVFGEQSDRGTPPQAAANIIDHFLGAGGNHIDTANVYAGGRSEEIVGSALAKKRANVVLATKVRFAMGARPNDQGLSLGIRWQGALYWCFQFQGLAVDEIFIS